jgi:Sulfotransferase domain
VSARVLHIVEKVAPLEYFPAVPQNFILRAGDSVPPEIVVDSPNVSLYCLDDENRQALFLETPPGVDLLAAPFFYLAQYKNAQRLIAVPYDTFHQLADGLTSSAGNLILIYSVGRCGSTLISQSLNAVDGVRSYSEPDVYTQITMLRHGDRSRDAEYARLIRSCTRMLGRNGQTVALKFRASGIHLGDLFYQVFPEARSLFLYRNAETWLESMNAGFTPNLPSPDAQPLFMKFVLAQAPLLMPFIRRHRRPASLAETYTLNWLSVMDKYLQLRRAGVPFLAVRYEDIKAQPKPTLVKVLTYCGLPADGIDRAYDTFSTDSQEGTVLSRASRQQAPAPTLSPADYEQARAVLAEHPTIRTPDFDVSATDAVGLATE